MIRWFAATQIIIVHGWQIIVNETHGMNHFQCDSYLRVRILIFYVDQ